jgi:hypothetical protein
VKGFVDLLTVSFKWSSRGPFGLDDNSWRVRLAFHVFHTIKVIDIPQVATCSPPCCWFPHSHLDHRMGHLVVEHRWIFQEEGIDDLRLVLTFCVELCVIFNLWIILWILVSPRWGIGIVKSEGRCLDFLLIELDRWERGGVVSKSGWWILDLKNLLWVDFLNDLCTMSLNEERGRNVDLDVLLTH